MSWRLELWVEGPTDAVAGENLANTEPAGALVPIVCRTIHQLTGLGFEDFARLLPKPQITVGLLREKLREVRVFRGAKPFDLSAYASKMLAALYDSRRKGPETLVVATRDRDREPDRVQDRNAVHEAMRRFGWKGQVVAVCIENLEAWLLADPAAFKSCFDKGPESGLPGEPEREPDPKPMLRAILERYKVAEGSSSTSATYRDLAEHIDLDILAKNCPLGYGAFREHVKGMIVPLLAPPHHSPGTSR